MPESVIRTRVKICGITRVQDAELAMDCGADAIGLVRVPASPRYVALDHAAVLRDAMDGLVHCVVLFLDPAPEQVYEAISALQPSLLQFHGRESADFCAQFGVPWAKALSHEEFARRQHEFSAARLLLIDSHVPGQLGGTGHRIDDTVWPSQSVRPLLLAGGLNPANVQDVIQSLRPYGVDASSGLESGPGIKDADLVRQFFEQVRLADERLAPGTQP